MRILLTGVTGFAGSWLAEALLAEGRHELVGLCRGGQWPAELRHLAGWVALRPCDLCAYQFAGSHGLEGVRARPFNHVGPRQSPQFAVAHFARQLAEIRRGRRPPLLETGDLGAHRDLTDVRDVAAAYVLLLEGGRGG